MSFINFNKNNQEENTSLNISVYSNENFKSQMFRNVVAIPTNKIRALVRVYQSIMNDNLSSQKFRNVIITTKTRTLVSFSTIITLFKKNKRTLFFFSLTVYYFTSIDFIKCS